MLTAMTYDALYGLVAYSIPTFRTPLDAVALFVVRVFSRC